MSKIVLSIDKDIPIPLPKKGPGCKKPHVYTYPLKKLEIGDSFFVPHRAAWRVRSDLQRQAVNLQIKLTARDEGIGCRIWRIS